MHIGLDLSELALGIILLLPAFTLVFVLIAYPVGYELALSLTNRRVEGAGDFVGLANYVDLLADGPYWEAVATTLLYVVVASGAKLALGLAMALSLARPFFGRPIVFILLLLPWLYPAALSATALHWMLNPLLYTGLILRLDQIDHTASIWVETAWPLTRIILIDVWRGTSFVGVFLLVGLNAIPSDLFDFAALEGGSSWLVFRLVTLPLLKSSALLALTLSVGATLADFTNLYLLTGGRETTHVIGTLAYETALTLGDVGRGAAISLSIVPLVAVLVLGMVRLIEREGSEP
jgi:multiple sugar transport system permease protein